MRKCQLFFLLATSGILVSVNAAELASAMPQEWGEIEQGQKCPDISGKYDLIGKVLPMKNGFPGTLNYILHAANPAVAYDPQAEKYGILEQTIDGKLKVTIVLGAESKSTYIDSICVHGWIKIERIGKTSAEGNTVRYHTMTQLARNTDGDLVASYSEEMKSSTLFGLLQSNHTNSFWLRFAQKMRADRK